LREQSLHGPGEIFELERLPDEALDAVRKLGIRLRRPAQETDARIGPGVADVRKQLEAVFVPDVQVE
jgi:hypothetical protein